MIVAVTIVAYIAAVLWHCLVGVIKLAAVYCLMNLVIIEIKVNLTWCKPWSKHSTELNYYRA